MDGAERTQWIERYARGPELLKSALAKVPAEALKWRPAEGKWCAREVVWHCADSETIASTRIRYLVGEDRPTIHGYDENAWAKTFDYHALPLDSALREVEQVRAWTADWIRRLPASAWSREGTHTESGRYTAEKWLELYGVHLETHARRIERNLAAWNARATAGPAHDPSSGRPSRGREVGVRYRELIPRAAARPFPRSAGRHAQSSRSTHDVVRRDHGAARGVARRGRRQA